MKLNLQAPSMAVSLMIALLFLLPLASTLPSDTVLNAVEILADSSYVSMSLTLSLVSQTLTLTSPPSLTVFAPPDAAFRRSGQPALSLLQYHFCPLPLSLQTLRSLPAGTALPTLSPARTLLVTSSPSDPHFSLNNVTVATESPIFNDGSLIVFGVDDFMDPDFQSLPRKCGSSETSGVSRFREASESLRSRGHSATGSFLESQLLGFEKEPVAAITLFSPPDHAVEDSEPSVFLRHFVPCRLVWSDLQNMSIGTVLVTYLDTTITITKSKSENTLMLNGVSLLQPNFYSSDSLTVHGLSDVLPAPEEEAELESENRSDRRRIEDVMLNENIEF